MPDVAVPRGVLLSLAVEGIIPVLGGCAGALVAGPAGGLAGVAVGHAAEKAINYFGRGIVLKWAEWFQGQPPAAHQAALADLAALPADQARSQIAKVLEQHAPDVERADRERAVDYLAAIPRAVEQSLVSDASGGRTLPPTLLAMDPQALLKLLPTDAPPYPAPSPLPNSDYRLEELLGTGGFGAVYRASCSLLPYLPLAIKFCLDSTLLPALRQERDNLERLMKTGGEAWTQRIVRLYGYNLEHATPFLVYEYVAGGDLVQWLATRQAGKGRELNPQEVMELMGQVAEALAFAHEHGLVHRDLKPANVLIGDRTVKLADFGIGAVVAPQAARGSRIGSVAIDQLRLDEQVSLYRGAGTPLYMSQEQRRGEAPDPRHDLYSLGVMWYQLLIGDVTRELHPGWARELEAQFAVPHGQIELIQRCVGWIKERPRNAGELLREVRQLLASPAPKRAAEEVGTAVVHPVEPLPIPVEPAGAMTEPRVAALTATPPLPSPASERSRHIRLAAAMRQLLRGHEVAARLRGRLWPLVQAILLGFLLGGLIGGGVAAGVDNTLSTSYPTYNRNKSKIENDAELRAYLTRRTQSTTMAGLTATAAVFGIAGFTIWLRLRWRRKAREKADLDLEACIEGMLEAFPQECRAWGWIACLRDPQAVQALLVELESLGVAASPRA